MDVQLEKLVRLQEVDGQTAQLLEIIAALPKRLASLEHELEQRKQALALTEKALLAEETKRRRFESGLKDQQQKIVKYREQSSSVKTNEQFHALQHEVGFVEQEIRRIEDAELASMMESDTLGQRRNEARETVSEQSVLIEKQKKAIELESSTRRQDLEKERAERTELRQAIDPELLARYDRLAASSKRTPLARASGQRCLACQMALRPQYWNEVRTGTLLNCESCGRLLYFDPREEPVDGTMPF